MWVADSSCREYITCDQHAVHDIRHISGNALRTAGENRVPVTEIGTLDFVFHSNSKVFPVSPENVLVIPETCHGLSPLKVWDSVAEVLLANMVKSDCSGERCVLFHLGWVTTAKYSPQGDAEFLEKNDSKRPPPRKLLAKSNKLR